jgi:hypothetical protein
MKKHIEAKAIKDGETPMEFLRRVVSNMNMETEGLLDALPSVEAVIEYFTLWKVYDTDFLSGIFESIADGQSPKAYNDFLAKYNLTQKWPEAQERGI